MSDLRMPKCLNEDGPKEAYRMAYSLYMGQGMESLPTRSELAARREACKLSESGYQVCISVPRHQVTEGAVSFSRFGWYMHDYYMFNFTDPNRGNMTLEIRREWGFSGISKDYSIFLWDGARHLVASVEEAWLRQWGTAMGDRQALFLALNLLCRSNHQIAKNP